MTSQDEAADLPVKRKKKLPLVLAFCIPAMMLLKMGFFFLVIGMLPTLLAFAFLRTPKDYILSILAAFNFAGVFPDLLGISLEGGTPRAVLDHLSTASVWLSMYAAALLGWIIVWLSPAIATMFIQAINRGRMQHMEHIQKKLEEEWGPEIKG